MNWTKEEILEYNKRCAEFLGVDVDYSIEVYKDSKSPLRNHIDNKPKSEPLLFDDDWNWIMEVILAINMIPNPKNPSDATLQTKRTAVQSILRSANKEAVVKAINQFLIWYEQNK